LKFKDNIQKLSITKKKKLKDAIEIAKKQILKESKNKETQTSDSNLKSIIIL